MPLRPTRDWGQQGYLPHTGRRATRDGTRDQPASINALTGQSHTHGRRHLGVGARHHRIFPRAAERTKHGLTPTRPRSNHAAMRDWQEDLAQCPAQRSLSEECSPPPIHSYYCHSFIHSYSFISLPPDPQPLPRSLRHPRPGRRSGSATDPSSARAVPDFVAGNREEATAWRSGFAVL